MSLVQKKDVFISFIIGLIFIAVLSPMVVLNNQDLSIVTAAFIDSGSLLHDFLKIVGPPINLNQNIQYHAGIYGWVNNSLIVYGILLAKLYTWIAGGEVSFFAIASWSRSVSLIFTGLGLSAFFLLCRSFRFSYFLSFIIILPLAIYPALVKFAYEIHPEATGFFFSVCCLYFLKMYVDKKGEDARFLYMSWGASVLAVLSKQTFLVYPLFVFVSFFLLHGPAYIEKRKLDKKDFLLIRNLILLSLALVFVFHPYSLIHPLQFLAKQKAIHDFHSTLYHSYAETARAWFNNMLYGEYWFLVVYVFAFVRLVKNRFKGTHFDKFIDLACVFSFLFFFLFVFQLRFFFNRCYLYAMVPLLAFTGFCLLQKAKRYIKVLAVLLILSLYIPYGIVSAAIISRDYLITNTNNFNFFDRMQSVGKQDWIVVYSVSLPVPKTLYNKTINSFQFTTTKPNFATAVAETNLDVMYIDHSFQFSDPQAFIKAAEKAGLSVAKKIKGNSIGYWSCTLNALNFDPKCTEQMNVFFFNKSPDKEIPQTDISIYVKPSLKHFFDKE